MAEAGGITRGRILGGALFAAAQHAVLFERVMAAWDRHSGLMLKRWLLAAWAQAASEFRLEREGGPLLFRFLEEEVEQLSRSAELLRTEALQQQRAEQQERLRHQREWEASSWYPQIAEGQSTSVDASAHGGSSLVEGIITESESNIATSSTNGTEAERLAHTVAFLFWHAVQHWCNSPSVAHSCCCDQAGRVSRRAFTGLVVKVLGVSSGLAARNTAGRAADAATIGLLAEVVGAVWPLLDPTGSGVVHKAAFLHLAEAGV